MHIQSNLVPRIHSDYDVDINTSGVISTFNTHDEAEEAVRKLQSGGFNMKRLSIVGRDFQTEESIIGFYNMGDRAKYWGKLGAFWGGLWGLLFGSALFIIPGVGPLVIAGAFVTTIVSVIEGAVLVGGLTAFGAALFSIGIPKNSVLQYEAEVKLGKYLMLVHGNRADVEKAQKILSHTKVAKSELFDASDADEG